MNSYITEEYQIRDILEEKRIKLEEYLRACMVANNLKRKVRWEIQK